MRCGRHWGVLLLLYRGRVLMMVLLLWTGLLPAMQLLRECRSVRLASHRMR